MRDLPAMGAAVSAPGPVAGALDGQEAGGVHLEGGCQQLVVDGYRVEWDADGGTGGSQACTVEAFFRARDPHAAAARVEGRAGCSGKAAGLYAGQLYEGNTLLDDRTGRFTEDSALMAYFECGAVAADDENPIGMMISSFMDGGRFPSRRRAMSEPARASAAEGCTSVASAEAASGRGVRTMTRTKLTCRISPT